MRFVLHNNYRRHSFLRFNVGFMLVYDLCHDAKVVIWKIRKLFLYGRFWKIENGNENLSWECEEFWSIYVGGCQR